MLDKENIRQWLISQGYQGDGEPPVIPDSLRLELAEIYANLHGRLLGRDFIPSAADPLTSLYEVLEV